MIAILTRALRLLLILVAAHYLWKGLRASTARPPRAPNGPRRTSAHPIVGDAEDIDYEDIT